MVVVREQSTLDDYYASSIKGLHVDIDSLKGPGTSFMLLFAAQN
jgi:hypothetical protein